MSRPGEAARSHDLGRGPEQDGYVGTELKRARSGGLSYD